MELGLLKNNYKEHPRYSEYVAKDGIDNDSWESYECFVEWITRPVNEDAYDKCDNCRGMGWILKELW